MSCITKLLEMKGDKDFLAVHDQVVIEGGGNYKGFEYLITFTSYGTRCGYVAIPDDKNYDSSELYVHGGITFEDRTHGAKNLLPTPCNDMWLGFDAAHFGDMRDMEQAKKYFGGTPRFDATFEMINELHKEVHEMEMRDPNCSHKTFSYMADECKHLIDQIIEQAA